MSNLSILNNIVNNRYNTYDVLHRKYGIVKTVLSYARAIVTVEDKDMLELQEDYKKNAREGKSNDDITGKRDLNLLNKTGEVLEVGDAVWVYYWHDVASGYIAMRIGAKQKEKASARISRAAVLPAPTPDNIYSNAKIYPDYVWDETISSRTYFIDDDKNLTFQTGAGGNQYYPQFNLFLVNGFPTVIIPYLQDFYHGNGTYQPDNYEYIIQHLNMVNPHLFSNIILFTGSISFCDLLIDPYAYSWGSYMTIGGDIRLEIVAFKRHSVNYYLPAVKLTCNGVEHLIEVGGFVDSGYSPYYSESELLSNVSMILVSTGDRVTYTSLRQQSIELGIAIRCKKDGAYAWGLINTKIRGLNYDDETWKNNHYLRANFSSIDEYYYCLCVK